MYIKRYWQSKENVKKAKNEKLTRKRSLVREVIHRQLQLFELIGTLCGTSDSQKIKLCGRPIRLWAKIKKEEERPHDIVVV